MFYIILLKRASNNLLLSQVQDNTQPPAIVLEDSLDSKEEWQVEEILDAKKTRGTIRVLVKWTSYVQPI